MHGFFIFFRHVNLALKLDHVVPKPVKLELQNVNTFVNLTQMMRVGGLPEWDQQFTPNLTQLMSVGGVLECYQHFTPNLTQLMRVGGLLVILYCRPSMKMIHNSLNSSGSNCEMEVSSKGEPPEKGYPG